MRSAECESAKKSTGCECVIPFPSEVFGQSTGLTSCPGALSRLFGRGVISAETKKWLETRPVFILGSLQTSPGLLQVSRTLATVATWPVSTIMLQERRDSIKKFSAALAIIAQVHKVLWLVESTS